MKHFVLIFSVLQSISEEEQQRILSEQKMVGFKKSTGVTAPGSKKSSKAKVSVFAIILLLSVHLSISCLPCIILSFVILCGLCLSFSLCALCIQSSPVKPKRPISAMFIFAEEKRQKLQQERPDLSDSELTRLLARMWNDLSDKKKVTCWIKKNSNWLCWYHQQRILFHGLSAAIQLVLRVVNQIYNVYIKHL